MKHCQPQKRIRAMCFLYARKNLSVGINTLYQLLEQLFINQHFIASFCFNSGHDRLKQNVYVQHKRIVLSLSFSLVRMCVIVYVAKPDNIMARGNGVHFGTHNGIILSAKIDPCSNVINYCYLKITYWQKGFFAPEAFAPLQRSTK